MTSLEIQAAKSLALRKGYQLSEAENHLDHPWHRRYHPAWFLCSINGGPVTTFQTLEEARKHIRLLANHQKVFLEP